MRLDELLEAMAPPTIKWNDVGGGAHMSADKRWYIAVSSRYLGRGKTVRSAELTDMRSGKIVKRDLAGLRAAKEAALKLLAGEPG